MRFQGGILNKIIDIVATGSGQDFQTLKHSIATLQNQDFHPRHSPLIFQDDPLYSAPDSVRLKNFVDALRAEDSQIIWSERGGCGTKRLLPHLELIPSPKNPKTMIGFSDVTALLIFVTQKWGWQGIHGPTLNYFTQNRLRPDIREMMFALCRGEKVQVVHDQLIPLNIHGETVENLEAPITGGNLSVLEYSIGTSWQIRTAGHFLFFEDIDEMPYRIAERLDHFDQAGLLRNVQGIFFGDFSHQKTPPNQELLNYVLKDFASKQPCPVFSNLQCGHFDQNLPIGIGQAATLRPSENGTFTLTQDLLIL